MLTLRSGAGDSNHLDQWPISFDIESLERIVGLYDLSFQTNSFVLRTVKLNANRTVTGVLRGYDQVMVN